MVPLRLRQTDLEWQEIDDEIVALDTQRAVYLTVRGTGAVVWRLLAETTSRQELADTLASTYGIDHARAHSDVEAFLSQLREQGLLT